MTEEDLQSVRTTYSKVLDICEKALGDPYPFELVKYGSAVNGLSLSRSEHGSDLDLILLVNSILNEDLK